MKSEVESLNFKLGEFNIASSVDFVVPRATIPRTKIKIANLENILEKMQQNKQFSDLISEQSKKTLEIKNTKIFTFLLDKQEHIKQRLLYHKQKVALEEKIATLETIIDKGLAMLFASVYSLSNSMTCFTDSQLSYHFFNMIKTNIVINEIEFLLVFFNSIEPRYAKALIIFNYSIFNTNDFVDKVVTKNAQTVKESIQGVVNESLILKFVMNFSSLVNLYKDQTEFSTTQNQNLKIGGCFLANFYFLIKRTVGIAGTLTKEAVISYTLGLVADILISMVPFLGSLPLIRSFFVKIFTRIFNFILTIMIKTFSFTIEQLAPLVAAIGKTFSTFVNKKYFLDLNFKKIIKYEIDAEANQADEQKQEMLIKVDDLEKVYFNVFQDGKSIVSLTQKINLFNPHHYLISEEELSNEKFLYELLSHKIENNFKKVSSKNEVLSAGRNAGDKLIGRKEGDENDFLFLI